MSRLPTLVLLAALWPGVALSQKQVTEPARPAMYAGADTNDAQAYYDFGLAQLEKDPMLADAGFYWAARLNPTRADAFYARRVAQLLTNSERLARYWRGDRSTLRSDDIRRIDSLYLQALMLNPFFYEGLERRLQDAVIAHIARQESNAYGGTAGAVEYSIQRYLSQASYGEKAFRAYSDGRFSEALELYARAIKEPRTRYYNRMMRGRLFFQLDQPDSALNELTLAVEDMRKKDKKDLIYVYQSKALLEHAIGMAHERLGEREKAKEAYARALQEDLAYVGAHVRLAYLALNTRDSVAAVSEFALATQLRPDDAGLRYQYGFILLETGKLDEAEEHLRESRRLNPVYALPAFALGHVYERQGRKAEARSAYQAFLGLVSRQDPRRADATARIQALGTR